MMHELNTVQPRKSTAPTARPMSALTATEYATYLPLVRSIAMRAARRLPRHVSTDDLVGYGWVGLLEALRRAPKDMPACEFQTYASHRVRGAILDYLRACDPTARDLRRKQRAIVRAKNEIERQGATATDEQIADKLAVTVAAYRDTLLLLERAGVAKRETVDVTSIDLAATALAPDELAHAADVRARIAAAIQTLPERLRQVLALYHQEECTLREIGAVLGVSESRASQLHTEATTQVRHALGLTKAEIPLTA